MLLYMYVLFMYLSFRFKQYIIFGLRAIGRRHPADLITFLISICYYYFIVISLTFYLVLLIVGLRAVGRPHPAPVFVI